MQSLQKAPSRQLARQLNRSPSPLRSISTTASNSADDYTQSSTGRRMPRMVLPPFSTIPSQASKKLATRLPHATFSGSEQTAASSAPSQASESMATKADHSASSKLDQKPANTFSVTGGTVYNLERGREPDTGFLDNQARSAASTRTSSWTASETSGGKLL